MSFQQILSDNKNTLHLVILSGFSIFITIYLIHHFRKKKENFCNSCKNGDSYNKFNSTKKQPSHSSAKVCGTCQGIGKKVCTDRKLLRDLYSKGELTEFSDFDKIPSHWRQSSWDNFLSNTK